MAKKAVADLRGERGRATAIVSALAIGIAGFFTVLSAYAILTRALNVGYLATDPPSALLTVGTFDAKAVAAVAGTSGVAVAEARSSTRGRVRVGPAQWKNLVLFAREDLATSRIGTLTLERGAWPSRPGEIAIERDALQVAGVTVGDSITVRTEGGQDQVMQVTASLHDVGQAQARMENLVYGYVTMDALSALGSTARREEIALRVSEQPFDEAHIVSVAEAIKQTLEARGTQVLRVDVPEAGHHPHAKIMGLLMMSLAVFGALILVLSGVLVFNVLTALLAAQVKQIGVMQALGASRTQMAAIYLFQAGALGLASVAVALPFGHAGAHMLCQAMARFLNFNVVDTSVPLWVYALVVVVGLAVPLAAALLPVWRGTRVPVRVALSVSGPVARTFGDSWLDRALTRVGGRNRIILLALRNAARSRVRVLLTLVTLVGGGVFFMAALNVRQSLVATVDAFYATTGADLFVVLDGSQSAERVEPVVKRVPGVSAGEAWQMLEGSLPGVDRSATRNRFPLQGVPLATAMVKLDAVLGEAPPRGARDVVVSSSLWERLKRPAIGADVSLWVDNREETLHVTGVVREPFAPPTAYVARAFTEGRGTTALRIALSDASNPALMKEARAGIEAALTGEGIRIVQATSKAESRYSFDQHMVMIYVFLVIVSCILAAVGVLGLLTTQSLNVSERRRELGVLRAIGATPAHIAQLVVTEGALIGATAWLISAAIVVPLTKSIGDLILARVLFSGAEITMAVEPRGLVIWLAVSILGSALASFWPAWQATRLSTREALAFE